MDMFVWTSGFHNPLVHTDFNMFVDEWMSVNESPVMQLLFACHCQLLSALFSVYSVPEHSF